MRGDDDEPPVVGELANQLQHALDLDVVEMRGRLVGKDHRRVVGERPGDGHPPAAARPTYRPDGASAGAQGRRSKSSVARVLDARRPIRSARIGTITFSSALSDGTRLNAWNTIPTVCRRYCVSAAPQAS